MFCSECGAELSQDAKFCAGCGAKIKNEETEQAVPHNVSRKGKMLIAFIAIFVMILAVGAVAEGVAWYRISSTNSKKELQKEETLKKDHKNALRENYRERDYEESREDIKKEVSEPEKQTDETKDYEKTSSVETRTIIASGIDSGIEWNVDSEGILYLTGDGREYCKFGEEPEWCNSERIGGRIKAAVVNVINPTSTAYWFENLSQLEKVEFGEDFDTSRVVNMSYMFCGCTSLSQIDLNSLDTSKVEYMEDMFWGCSSLTKVDICKIDTSSVTGMLGMFYGCSSLTYLDLRGLDFSSVIDMRGMFGNCTNLRSLNLEGLDTSNVMDMMGMFSGCENLESLDISSFNLKNTMDVCDFLTDCSSLESLKVPLNLKEDVDLPCPMYDVQGNQYIGIPKDCTKSFWIYSKYPDDSMLQK